MSLCQQLKFMLIVSSLGVAISCGKQKSNSNRAPEPHEQASPSTQPTGKDDAGEPKKNNKKEDTGESDKKKNIDVLDPNDHTLILSESDSDFYVATVGSLKIKLPARMKKIMLNSGNGGEAECLCSSDTFYIENTDKNIPQRYVTADLMISRYSCKAEDRQSQLENNFSGTGKALSIKPNSDGFIFQAENQTQPSRNFHGGLVIRSINDCYSYSMAVFDMGSTSPESVRNVVAFLRDRLDQAFQAENKR